MNLDRLMLASSIVILVLSALVFSKADSKQNYKGPLVKFIPAGNRNEEGKKWSEKTVKKCKDKLNKLIDNSCQNDPINDPYCADYPYVFCDSLDGPKLIPTGTLNSKNTCVYEGRLAYEPSQCDEPLTVNTGILCGGKTNHDCLTCESTSVAPPNPWDAEGMCDK